MQDEINVQVGKFLKNIILAGQNRRAGGKLVLKTLNVQESFSSKLINVHARLFSTLEYLTFSALLVLKCKNKTPMGFHPENSETWHWLFRA